MDETLDAEMNYVGYDGLPYRRHQALRMYDGLARGSFHSGPPTWRRHVPQSAVEFLDKQAHDFVTLE